MAMQPAIASQNGRGVWLYNQLPANASQISSLQRLRLFFADSLLMPRSAVEAPQLTLRSAGLIACTASVSVFREWLWQNRWQTFFIIVFILFIFSAGFRRGGVIGLCDWPRPLTLVPRAEKKGYDPGSGLWTEREKAERGGAGSRYHWTTPQSAPIVPLATPLNDGCRGKCVYGSSWAHYSTHVSDRCDSGQNKTHTFSKREQKSFSAYHKRPALMQPVCTAVSTLCHAGHPCCVDVCNDCGKMRLYTPIRSKTTALPRCARQPQCAAKTLKSAAQRWWISWKKEP